METERKWEPTSYRVYMDRTDKEGRRIYTGCFRRPSHIFGTLRKSVVFWAHRPTAALRLMAAGDPDDYRDVKVN